MSDDVTIPEVLLSTNLRFTIVSTMEVPLTVDAPDWRSALVLALQLLERSDCIDRLRVRCEGDVITAVDPQSAERFIVQRRGRAWLRAA